MSESRSYDCPWCVDGLVQIPTMLVTRDGSVASVMAPRRCKSCRGSGRASCPPGTPPVP